MKAKELLLVGRSSVNDYYVYKKQIEETIDGAKRVTQERGRYINGFYIGMGKSGKQVKVYNKTRELDKSNKNYIAEFWKKNQIDTSRDVQRLELSLSNDECKKYPNINWELLDQPSHQASILKSGMSKFAEFRVKTNDKNISRWPIHEIINWEQLQGEALPKNSTIASNEIWTAKITCKKLFEIHYISSDQQFYDVAFEIAINTDLVEWFTKMQPHWIKDMEFKAKAVGGDLTELPWKYHFKRYHAGEKVLMFQE
jgi:hypothetical protein